ncbi:MAG: DUF3301 domain-containing protein [Gammaproteobacteria bacterium]|nr:DUF3301 domain-containing protein [Gammaproteobacteria bacterium]
MIWLLGVAALGVWFWFDSMRARERAILGAQALCERESLQFLDDTVALRRLNLGWGARGLHLQRIYRFEYATTATNRHHGCIFVVGSEPVRVALEI